MTRPAVPSPVPGDLLQDFFLLFIKGLGLLTLFRYFLPAWADGPVCLRRKSGSV
jgi:hypothetical protein